MALTRVRENQINTVKFGFADPLLPINDLQSGTNTSDIGLILNRGNAANIGIYWDEANKVFRVAFTNTNADSTDTVNVLGNAPILTGNQTISTGNFQVHNDAKAGIYIMRNTTSGTANTQLYLDGAMTQLIVSDNSVWTYEVLVTAKRTDEGGHGAAFKIVGAVGKDATSSSIFMIGTPSITTIGRTNEIWTASTGVDASTGALTVNVSGSLGNTVAWVAKIVTTEVVY
jgi:hypothetical protein